jgi:GcrA cell cycle regulator
MTVGIGHNNPPADERLDIVLYRGRYLPADHVPRRRRGLRGGLIASEFWERNDCKLRELVEAGKTATAAGAEIGVSKNAVIGRAYRLCLQWARKPSPRRPPTPPAFIPPVPLAGCCAWPHGHPDQRDFHYCDEAALRGRPYCAAHAAVAYERPKELGAAA